MSGLESTLSLDGITFTKPMDMTIGQERLFRNFCFAFEKAAKEGRLDDAINSLKAIKGGLEDKDGRVLFKTKISIERGDNGFLNDRASTAQQAAIKAGVSCLTVPHFSRASEPMIHPHSGVPLNDNHVAAVIALESSPKVVESYGPDFLRRHTEMRRTVS